MKLATLCEVICAAHLSSYVKAPVADRGGVMLVAPPGRLKTTILSVLDRHYSSCLSYSNLNTRTLTKIRGDLGSRAIRSLVLPDLQSLYAGDPRTSQRIEQTIMQLSSEGHIGASWEDSRFRRFESRATIFAAMPNSFFELHADEWEKSGFLRRFLWVFYDFADPSLVINRLVQWERLRLNGLTAVPQVPVDDIPAAVTSAELRQCESWLKYQPGPHEIQLVMLGRIISVLRWHYERVGIKSDAMATVREFAEGLGNRAAELVSVEHNGAALVGTSPRKGAAPKASTRSTESKGAQRGSTA